MEVDAGYFWGIAKLRDKCQVAQSEPCLNISAGFGSLVSTQTLSELVEECLGVEKCGNYRGKCEKVFSSFLGCVRTNS